MSIKPENLKLQHIINNYSDQNFGRTSIEYNLKHFVIVNDRYERVTVEEFINLTGMVLEELESKVEDLQSQINQLKGV